MDFEVRKLAFYSGEWGGGMPPSQFDASKGREIFLRQVEKAKRPNHPILRQCIWLLGKLYEAPTSNHPST